MHDQHSTQSTHHHNSPQSTHHHPVTDLHNTQDHETLANNDFVGTPLPHTKPDDTLRIYYTNQNGIKLDAIGGEFTEFIAELQHMDGDILCLAETNLDTTNYKVNQRMNEAAHNIFDYSA